MQKVDFYKKKLKKLSLLVNYFNKTYIECYKIMREKSFTVYFPGKALCRNTQK